MAYIDQFEPCHDGVDMAFDGVEEPLTAKNKDMFPYFISSAMYALSHVAMIERTSVFSVALYKMTKDYK